MTLRGASNISSKYTQSADNVRKIKSNIEERLESIVAGFEKSIGTRKLFGELTKIDFEQLAIKSFDYVKNVL